MSIPNVYNAVKKATKPKNIKEAMGYDSLMSNGPCSCAIANIWGQDICVAYSSSALGCCTSRVAVQCCLCT